MDTPIEDQFVRPKDSSSPRIDHRACTLAGNPTHPGDNVFERFAQSTASEVTTGPQGILREERELTTHDVSRFQSQIHGAMDR